MTDKSRKIKELFHQPKLRSILRKYDVSFAAVFGSRARDQAGFKSDLDILVDFRSQVSLFDLIRLERELEAVLPYKVDLVPQNSLNPKLLPHIKKDLKPVYKAYKG